MKKIIRNLKLPLIGILVLIGLNNCALSGFGPQGILFTSQKMGIYATNPEGSKKGSACASSILGLVSTGDASVQEAVRRASITKVNNINLESFSILGVYATLCTNVQGE